MPEPLLHRDRHNHALDSTLGRGTAYRWDMDRIAEDEGTQ